MSALIVVGNSPQEIHRELRGITDRCHSKSRTALEFSRELSRIHERQRRTNGTSALDHVREVERLTGSVLRKPENFPTGVPEHTQRLIENYNNSTLAAALLHDVDEDVLGIRALKDAIYQEIKLSGISTYPEYAFKIILNQELARYGPEGEQVSYMVYNVTKPTNKGKFHYMEDTLDKIDTMAGSERGGYYPLPDLLKDDGVNVHLVLLLRCMCVKTADRSSNTNYSEQYIYDGKEARELVDLAGGGQNRVGALLEILKKKGISKGFEPGGKFEIGDSVFGIGEAFRLFEIAYQMEMAAVFETFKRANAMGNLTHFLPEVERILLLGAGFEEKTREFSQAKADDFLLFNYAKMRALIKGCCVESLKIWDSILMSASPPSSAIGLAKETLAGKHAGEVSGYTPILDEIKNERGL
ncbi:MAG: hypothetical protein V1909_03740 [Candidatus Micrarchaeota archaeon]